MEQLGPNTGTFQAPTKDSSMDATTKREKLRKLINDIETFQLQNTIDLEKLRLEEKQKAIKYYQGLMPRIIDAINGNQTSIYPRKANIQEIERYVFSDFNLLYMPPEKFIKEWEEGFITLTAHQLCGSYHPMTCGVNSRHDHLVFRIGYGGERYWVCPTCGMVQSHLLF